MTEPKIKFDIVKTRVTSTSRKLNVRWILDEFIFKKALTVNDSGHIVPEGYTKRELEEMFSWLNEQAGVNGWTFTGKVLRINDPKVQTMFLLRWA